MFLELIEKSSDAIGIFGVILLLIAYTLLSTDRMSPRSMMYQWLNFAGALFILVSLMYHWNTASVLIEIAWIIISIIGMIGISRSRRGQ